MSSGTEGVQQNLSRLGLTNPLQIALGEGPSQPVTIAAERLHALFAGHGLDSRAVAHTDGAGIVLQTRECASPDVAAGLAINEVRPDDDAYQIIQAKAEGDLHVIGSNPRSVIYGVYALYDLLLEEITGPLDVFEKAHFKQRIMCPSIEGRSDNPNNLAYLSRMGVNTTFLRARMCPIIDVKHFFFYVRDDEHVPAISKHNPPNDEIVKMASGCYRIAQEYGLDTILFMDEPVAVASKEKKEPQQGMLVHETLVDLDADLVGEPQTVRYREDGWKAISVFHPKVERHYETMMARIMEMFPRLRLLYLYNEDAGASNCTPQSDPCGRTRYPQGYEGFPYLAYTHLASLLQQTGRRVRPDFRVLIPTFHWGMEQDSRHRLLGDFPADSALNLIAYNDCVPFVSQMTDWGHELCEAVRNRPDLELLCEDDFTGTNEDQLREVTAGYPMPLRTWKKMHIYAKEGAIGVIQHHVGGPTFGVNSLNDLAWRVFSWNPLMEREEARAKVRELIRAQLGDDQAAEKMLLACDAVDRALDADEAGADSRPYQARFGHAVPGLFGHPLLVGEQDQRRQEVEEYFGVGWEGSPACWLETLKKEEVALTEGARYAREAADVAPTDRKPHYIYQAWPALTDCRAYAQGIAEAIQVVLCFKRTMIHRLTFSGVGGADAATLEDTRAAEIENCREMLKALHARQPWIQTPPGRRTLDMVEDIVRKKLALMESEAR